MSYNENIEIIGSFSLSSSKVPLYEIGDLSSFRVQFIKSEGSLNNYISAKACILTASGIKVFAISFIDVNGKESTIVQIPLTGQTIDSLVKSINSYQDIVCEIVNASGFISTMLLEDTAFVDISGKWAYFNSSNIDINSAYTSLDNDLRFYLTSVEPISEQKNLTQSLGGFVSLSEVYKGLSLSDSLSIYDNVMYINTKSISYNFSILDLQKSEYLQINDEIIKINKWVGNVAYISERNVFDTPLRMHPKGSIVREIAKNNFFDANFGDNRKQYRCIAIKNNNKTDIAKNVKVFLNINSRNNLSIIRLAIEPPSSDYYSGISSSSGITAFSVSDLVGKFENNHFASAPLVFTSGSNTGQFRIVKSYNKTSGVLELDQRLPNAISVGDEFYIDTAPSQRIKSGTKLPVGSRVSAFFDANDRNNALSININRNRLSGFDLRPNEVVYIWVEREISESNDEFINNRFALSLVYNKI